MHANTAPGIGLCLIVCSSQVLLGPVAMTGCCVLATEKKTYDFSDEVVYYEGPPHRADLAINLALGTTLLWLPLTAAAIGRSAFISYRFTNKRVSVQTTAPWKSKWLCYLRTSNWRHR